MQTNNAFYGSAQILKFKNDFTKPLSLKRIPKDIYSLHCFIFQKVKLLFVFAKYSMFLMVLINIQDSVRGLT